mgnify:CR=1 FL=1|jgi:hypothetical protein
MYVVVKGKGECANTWLDSGQILLAAEIGSLQSSLEPWKVPRVEKLVIRHVTHGPGGRGP